MFTGLTSMFLHGGWLHIIGNMWTLWIFGDNVEDRTGPFRFVVFYLLCGLAAGLVHCFTNPDSTLPTVGAWGAIAGVMGAYFFLVPTARVVVLVPVFLIPFFFELPAVIYLGFWALSQVFSGTLALALASERAVGASPGGRTSVVSAPGSVCSFFFVRRGRDYLRPPRDEYGVAGAWQPYRYQGEAR